jgi:dephospho-CoA kinase
MKLCGLTGGVGMGKSTTAGFLLEQGVKVLDTDAIARELVQPGRPALKEIQAEFGAGMLAEGGELKREQLARLVFADAAARKRLEDILHPRIRETWLKQVAEWRQEQCPLAVVIIPLLYETQAEAHFDRVICVACSAASQEKRLRARGWAPEQIQQRIAAQMPVEQKIGRSQFVIWTEGELEVHQEQIRQILGKL